MPSVIATSTGAIALGRMWRQMMRKRAGPDRLRPRDELALLQRQELGADQAGHAHPAGEADHRHDRPDRGPQERQHGQEQEEAREDQHQVDEPHDHRVDRSAVVAGGGAEQRCRSSSRCPPTRSRRPATRARRRACARARRARADRCRSGGGCEGEFEDLLHVGPIRDPTGRSAGASSARTATGRHDDAADQREPVAAKRPPEDPARAHRRPAAATRMRGSTRL